MTYEELKLEIEKMTLEQRRKPVFVYLIYSEEIYEVDSISYTTDLLNQAILNIEA